MNTGYQGAEKPAPQAEARATAGHRKLILSGGLQTVSSANAGGFFSTLLGDSPE
jgi:hypothetical protein